MEEKSSKRGKKATEICFLLYTYSEEAHTFFFIDILLRLLLPSIWK